jgi:hypothetical protein
MLLERVWSSRLRPLIALAVLLSVSPGCLVRWIKVARPGLAPNARLLNANLEELLDDLQLRYQQIQTLQITADMEPSLGSVQKGELAQLRDIRGIILIREPSDIRVIGRYPVVRNQAFDMVSNGVEFKLWVPLKNKFIVGKNQVERPSKNKLEDLRPAHIMEALAISPPVDGEQPVLENVTDEARADYIIHTIKNQNGRLVLFRNIWFDRVNLRVIRQEIFDEDGDIISDTRYDNYDKVQGIQFPKLITIMRPKEEYGVKLTVLKVDINSTLGNDKFELAQPAGSELLDLSKRPAPNAGAKGGQRG